MDDLKSYKAEVAMANSMRRLAEVLGLVLTLAVLMFSTNAKALVAIEREPGILELRSKQDRGIKITEHQVRKLKNGKSWTYFCVQEDLPVRHVTSAINGKCFYGESNLFSNVKPETKILGIEYGLKNRVRNNNGLIQIGTQRHFYPVLVVYEQR